MSRATDPFGVPLLGNQPRWQIRIRSEQPTLIENSEEQYAPILRPVMERCYILCRRTSYMVDGPNREVWWAIDRWNYNTHKWVTIVDGKTRLKEGARPI